MPRLLRGYVGLGCTPNRRRRIRMRTGTQVSVHRNNTTAIPPGKKNIFRKSSEICLGYMRVCVLMSKIYPTFSQVIVCYYTIPWDLNTSWELSPSHIDPHICTHIIVGFASVVDNMLDIGDNAWVYKQVVALKNREPKLKVMISAGGNNELHDGFSEMVKTHANRKKYVLSSISHCYIFKIHVIHFREYI